MTLDVDVAKLRGPILVLGAGGFVGANLFRLLQATRHDVVGTIHSAEPWRLADIGTAKLIQTDLLIPQNIEMLLRDVKPKTIFNCIAYGAYSFEKDTQLIYATNFTITSQLMEKLTKSSIAAYVHAGSSSEYGDKSDGPDEASPGNANSDYSVSKRGAADLISLYGRRHGLPCVNLRLYSVYGPWEDSARLIPTIIREGSHKQLPSLVDPNTVRDFVYIDDVVQAFINAALEMSTKNYGESFNIGTGRQTTIRAVAEIARKTFGIQEDAVFGTMPDRSWDLRSWVANPEKARRELNWSATVDFEDGFCRTVAWYSALADKEVYTRNTKANAIDYKSSVSAIVACYRDEQAIPLLYQRLKKVFQTLKIDHEIIFVNDGSTDGSEAVIRELSARDRAVIGVTHSRNFGSQAAFRSGLEIASKNSCVLLDGDLQDPPELIEKFVEKWRQGFEVVFGRRVSREAPWFMQIAYKSFYRIFSYFSYIEIPKDAGDFSLLDRVVVAQLLRCQERDMFLRGLRAYVGFRQASVDYRRPERVFGSSTNNIWRNIGWAKKGILSFSRTPLNLLSFAGVACVLISSVLCIAQVILKLFFPSISPEGITTVLLVISFFGSVNLLGLALLGEYIAKIFEETKARPHFIRRSMIRGGNILPAGDRIDS